MALLGVNYQQLFESADANASVTKKHKVLSTILKGLSPYLRVSTTAIYPIVSTSSFRICSRT